MKLSTNEARKLLESATRFLFTLHLVLQDVIQVMDRLAG